MFEKIIGEVKGIFNIVTLIEMGLSILCILFGLVFFTNPNTNKVLIIIVSFLIIITYGITYCLSYLKRGDISLYKNNLIYGIITSIISIITIFLNNYLAIILGIFLLVNAVQKINYGIVLKKFNESSWLLIIVIGILYIIMGIISFFTNIDSNIKVSGIILFGFGLICIINNYLLRKRSKYFLD